MTFADQIIERDTEAVGSVVDLFDGCRMVVVHKDVFDAALGLVATSGDKIPEMSRFTCWPDYKTWIETERDERGRRFGFLFFGTLLGGDSVRYGAGMIYMQFEDGVIESIAVRYDLEAYVIEYDLPIKDPRQIAQVLSMAGADAETYADVMKSVSDPMTLRLKYAPLLTEIKPILFSLLALMNSPKLIRYKENDMAKLNARRIKRGKFPYYPHHEIRLNIDKHVLKVTPATGTGPERGQYFVRAHLRFLVHPRYKNVSVALVEPHYRGNPEIGIRNTRYAVDRENSKWA